MTLLAVYPSDVTDSQWAMILPLFDRTGQRGRPPTYELRRVFNGCACVVNTGCPWRSLPQDAYPPWSGVYKHFRRWAKSGLCERKRSAHPPLGAHDHTGFLSGSNSSMRLFGQEGSFSRVSVSQAIGSMAFRRAVSSSD